MVRAPTSPSLRRLNLECAITDRRLRRRVPGAVVRSITLSCQPSASTCQTVAG